MELYTKNDPEYFELSSEDSYDRHNYKVMFPDGRSVVFEDYEEMRAVWFQHMRNWEGCLVEVIDAKKESRTSTKGFGN